MEVTINGTRYVPRHDLDAVKARPMRGLRALTGLTLGAASAEIGCSKSHLHSIEHGKSIPGVLLSRRIAEVYGCALDDIANAVEMVLRSNANSPTPMSHNK